MGDQSEQDPKHQDWDNELLPPRSPVGELGDGERRRIFVTFAVFGTVLIIVIVAALLVWSESTKSRMTAENPLLSESVGGESRLGNIRLGATEMIYFHVTLNGAPVGRRLDMVCEWTEPGGIVVEVVEYSTSRIDKPIWPTHCRHRFTGDSPIGRWSVSIAVGDRELRSMTFNVEQRFGE